MSGQRHEEARGSQLELCRFCGGLSPAAEMESIPSQPPRKICLFCRARIVAHLYPGLIPLPELDLAHTGETPC